jgi:hypothetical protein
MKKIKLLSVIIVSLIITMNFFSCGKPYTPRPLSEELPNTVWQGQESYSFRIPDTETLKDGSYYGSVKILFLKDEASISANYTFNYQYLDTTYGYEYWYNGSQYGTFKGNATYSCNEDDITIKIQWDNELAEEFGGNEWIGTCNENRYSMFLRNVFGEIITFRKDY